MSAPMSPIFRWRYLRKKLLYLALASICLTIIVSTKNKSGQIREEKVRKLIDFWHEQEPMPKLYKEKGAKWSGYLQEDLVLWQEPKILAPNSSQPGNLGQPVILNKEEKIMADKSFSKHQLNVFASDKIGFDRVLPDVKNEMCIYESYPLFLPPTSIIIVFHNEAKSTLLRTVHSVINQSPAALIKEIILVDDNSDHEELQSQLDGHLKKLKAETFVLRLNQRQGLIRARLEGAKIANGPALLFIDAHVEVTPGWLPPLLLEIAKDRTTVVEPIIDDISDKDFSYEPAEDDSTRGGLDWKLMHSWISEYSYYPDAPETEPFPTPTLIGCAFAIDRDFFFASGSYDSQMNIWGGENVEMSIRIWRCGGSVIKVPCSHLGHVYREVSPHSVPGGIMAKFETATRNSARFAEVWIAEFKDFFYFMNPTAKEIAIGDVSERKQLLDDLQCHSFNWFLDYVYPDSSFPYHRLYIGQIEELDNQLCLDAHGTRGPCGMKVCHGLGGFQTLMHSASGEIRSATRCLEPEPHHDKSMDRDIFQVKFKICNQSRNQMWRIVKDPPKIVHVESGWCLTYRADSNTNKNHLKKPKSILKFLANVATDLTSKVIPPTIEPCDNDQSGATYQKFVLNLPAKWAKRAENIFMSQF